MATPASVAAAPLTAGFVSAVQTPLLELACALHALPAGADPAPAAARALTALLAYGAHWRTRATAPALAAALRRPAPLPAPYLPVPGAAAAAGGGAAVSALLLSDVAGSLAPLLPPSLRPSVPSVLTAGTAAAASDSGAAFAGLALEQRGATLALRPAAHLLALLPPRLPTATLLTLLAAVESAPFPPAVTLANTLTVADAAVASVESGAGEPAAAAAAAAAAALSASPAIAVLWRTRRAAGGRLSADGAAGTYTDTQGNYIEGDADDACLSEAEAAAEADAAAGVVAAAIAAMTPACSGETNTKTCSRTNAIKGTGTGTAADGGDAGAGTVGAALAANMNPVTVSMTVGSVLATVLQHTSSLLSSTDSSSASSSRVGGANASGDDATASAAAAVAAFAAAGVSPFAPALGPVTVPVPVPVSVSANAAVPVSSSSSSSSSAANDTAVSSLAAALTSSYDKAGAVTASSDATVPVNATASGTASGTEVDCESVLDLAMRLDLEHESDREQFSDREHLLSALQLGRAAALLSHRRCFAALASPERCAQPRSGTAAAAAALSQSLSAAAAAGVADYAFPSAFCALRGVEGGVAGGGRGQELVREGFTSPALARYFFASPETATATTADSANTKTQKHVDAAATDATSATASESASARASVDPAASAGDQSYLRSLLARLTVAPPSERLNQSSSINSNADDDTDSTESVSTAGDNNNSGDNAPAPDCEQHEYPAGDREPHEFPDAVDPLSIFDRPPSPLTALRQILAQSAPALGLSLSADGKLTSNPRSASGSTASADGGDKLVDVDLDAEVAEGWLGQLVAEMGGLGAVKTFYEINGAVSKPDSKSGKPTSQPEGDGTETEAKPEKSETETEAEAEAAEAEPVEDEAFWEELRHSSDREVAAGPLFQYLCEAAFPLSIDTDSANNNNSNNSNDSNTGGTKARSSLAAADSKQSIHSEPAAQTHASAKDLETSVKAAAASAAAAAVAAAAASATVDASAIQSALDEGCDGGLTLGPEGVRTVIKAALGATDAPEKPAAKSDSNASARAGGVSVVECVSASFFTTGDGAVSDAALFVAATTTIVDADAADDADADASGDEDDGFSDEDDYDEDEDEDDDWIMNTHVDSSANDFNAFRPAAAVPAASAAPAVSSAASAVTASMAPAAAKTTAAADTAAAATAADDDGLTSVSVTVGPVSVTVSGDARPGAASQALSAAAAHTAYEALIGRFKSNNSGSTSGVASSNAAAEFAAAAAATAATAATARAGATGVSSRAEACEFAEDEGPRERTIAPSAAAVAIAKAGEDNRRMLASSVPASSAAASNSSADSKTEAAAEDAGTSVGAGAGVGVGGIGIGCGPDDEETGPAATAHDSRECAAVGGVSTATTVTGSDSSSSGGRLLAPSAHVVAPVKGSLWDQME